MNLIAVSTDTWYQILGGFFGSAVVTGIAAVVIYALQQRYSRVERVTMRYLELCERNVHKGDHTRIKTLIESGVLTLKSNSEVRAVLKHIEQHGQIHPWNSAPNVPGRDEDLLDFLKDASGRDIKDAAQFIAFRIGRLHRGKKY
jgi:hypothetical protein